MNSILPFIAGPWQYIRDRCPGTLLESSAGCVTTSRSLRPRPPTSESCFAGAIPKIADIYDGPAAVVCPLSMGSGLKIKRLKAWPTARRRWHCRSPRKGLPRESSGV